MTVETKVYTIATHYQTVTFCCAHEHKYWHILYKPFKNQKWIQQGFDHMVTNGDILTHGFSKANQVTKATVVHQTNGHMSAQGHIQIHG